MKLSARDAKAFLRRPSPGVVAALVSGEDGARVARARAALVLAWTGEGAEAEMRVARMGAGDLRRDPALLLDALKATGFFPGLRAVVLEDATDGLADAVAGALGAWTAGDARLVVTGGALPARGALRRLFEGRADAAAITLYDDPPTEAEVAEAARAAGLRLDPAAAERVQELGRLLPEGEFAGLLERLALYQDDEPIPESAVVALSPLGGGEAEIDDAVAAATDGRRAELPGLLARLWAQGATPVGVASAAIRHLRAVLAAQADPGGVEAGLGALRLGGARRQAVGRAARGLRAEAAGEALRLLVALDLRLRSGGRAPDRALVEGALLRLATMAGRGRAGT